MFRRRPRSPREELERRIRREAARFRSPLRRINWPLLLGSLTVLALLGIAGFGRLLAPQDPLERHTIMPVGDGWQRPPFPVFTVPGFPLGSDDYGRDLLSRLLWAVRPTLVMIAVVAGVRLFLGALIGMAAGWLEGRAGQVLDMLIAGALAMPILMVALAAIAAVGAEVGVVAFILGLSITGWAETARIVREQTRNVKGHLYVEAARALGEPAWQILFRHVWRQIRPMIWMLLSLEISGTMMATAGLGFMGYYIGGDIWIETADFSAGRITGMPELGQMLATSYSGIMLLGAKGLPWAMASVGTVIFVIILGFNLLGEGLRLRLSQEQMGRRAIAWTLRLRLRWWLDEQVLRPLAHWARTRAARRVALAALAVVVVAAAGLLLQTVLSRVQGSTGAVTAIPIPGGHLWATERRDPYGTKYVETVGPLTPTIRLLFRDPAGFSGGPAISAEGTLYLTTKAGTLYALDEEGAVLWQANLAAAAVGTPALSAEGTIYVADREGGVSSFTPTGEQRWRLELERKGVSAAGPIVAPDGTVYYPVGNRVIAVSPAGALLWEAQVPYEYRQSVLQLSPDGGLVFFEEVAVRTADGTLVDLGLPASLEKYYVGANERTYYLSQQTMTEWREGPEGAEVVQEATWDYRAIGRFDQPRDAGVTPDGVIWMSYSSYGNHLVWLDTAGHVLGTVPFVAPHEQVIAVDGDANIYLCATLDSPACFAYSYASATPPSDEEFWFQRPLWLVPLERGRTIAGGAVVPGKLYVAVAEGFLFVLEEGK